MRLRFNYTENGVQKVFEIRPRETGVTIPVANIGSHYRTGTFGDNTYVYKPYSYGGYEWKSDYGSEIRAIVTRQNALSGNPYMLRENNMLYDRTVNINDATSADGQTMFFDGSAGTMQICAFIRTEYVGGVPVSKWYMGGIFNVHPATGLYWGTNALNISGTYSTEQNAIPIIDFALFTATENGVNYPCLLVSLFNGNDAYCYVFDMKMFDGTAPQPTTDNNTTTPYGRTGTYNFSSDKMTDVSPSGFNFVNQWAHGLTLYHITDVQASAIFAEMWGNETLGQMFKNATVKQIQGIVCLHKVPVPVASGLHQRALSIFGKRVYRGTTLDALNLVNSQLVKYPASPQWMPLEEIYGDYFDYAGQSKLSVYLPFVGCVPIDVNKVMGGAIQVVYYVDLLTGNCIARVYGRNSMNNGAEVLLYQGGGNCAMHIPYVGNDQGGMKLLGALAGVATAGITTLALGGAAAAPALAAVTGTAGAALAEHNAAVNNIPTEIAPLSYPYVCYIQEYPERLLTALQGAQLGFSAASGAAGSTVSNYSGYTQGVLHAAIAGATDDEKAEIERMFAEGVYL